MTLFYSHRLQENLMEVTMVSYSFLHEHCSLRRPQSVKQRRKCLSNLYWLSSLLKSIPQTLTRWVSASWSGNYTAQSAIRRSSTTVISDRAGVCWSMCQPSGYLSLLCYLRARRMTCDGCGNVSGMCFCFADAKLLQATKFNLNHFAALLLLPLPLPVVAALVLYTLLLYALPA